MVKALDTMVYEGILCSLFSELGKLLVSVFNYAFEVGEFSSSQKQAVITLIQKKDEDNMLIKNWIPISLINVDIIIASKKYWRLD